ncbi:MAG: LysR family hydrogen peroxide-inducible transcriptional activator [Candidatus Marivariicella framensis]|jgi:LysR family hydrogen peroxide-inducible transcriptional activator|tara:strand:+ start:1047 stop:1973 length:927 start_codon:yes stop_codon:yes gene_type:complete
MTLTQLQYTLAVAKYGNFTLAADKSNVTQPTLSMQVQKLEEELGAIIFNRNTKPIALTAVGEKIIKQAKNIIEESQKMRYLIDQEKGVVEGEFRLGIIPTVMPTLLPLFLNTFLKKFPKVRLKIEELNTKNFTEQILDGRIDAGIGATPLNNFKLIENPLYYEPFVGYVPENHPLYKNKKLQINDLESSKILILEDGHCFRNQMINLCGINLIDYKFSIKSGSFETMINLADEGLGMTLLPYMHTQSLSSKKQKNLRYFEDPAPAREISLIYSKAKLKLPIAFALNKVIDGIIRGTIQFENVKIIAPK